MKPAILPICLALLAGCTQRETFAPACPSLALLPDGGDLTRFDSRGSDVTDTVAEARITAIPAACTTDGPGKVRATVSVSVAAARGPAARGRVLDLPYIIAVLDGDRVLDRQAFSLRVMFPNNIDRVNATGEPIDLVLPVTQEKSAAAYRILVGLQLSPGELAFNRRRRR